MKTSNDGTRRRGMLGLGMAVAFALAVGPVHGQEGVIDARWLPFVGCWEAAGAEDEIGLLCFSPAEGGVELTNYSGGDIVSTERMVADGAARSIDAEGCEGSERVEFSFDGRRAFTATEFTCGDGELRSGTGVMAFTAPNYWVDVRVLDVGGEEVAWVQEYLLASRDRLAEEGLDDPSAGRSLAVRSARMAASAPIDLDDVEEAAARMGDRAVETWVVAQRDVFDVDAEDLVRLDDAGVSDRIIDAVVAVSHPDRFLAETGRPVEKLEGPPVPTHYRGYMALSPWGAGYGYGPYGNRYGYSPFGFSSFGFSPFGYPPGFRYGFGFFGSRPGFVIIQRRSRAAPGGRVIKGRGYTRGGAAGRRIARPRGGASAESSVGSSNPSGAATRSTGDGGRKGSGRKAKRRSGRDS